MIEAEHVAREIKGADLPAAIVQDLGRAHGPGHDLVDVVGGLAFAVDFAVALEVHGCT